MRTILCQAILASGILLSRADQVPADDIVFKALADELKRSMTLHLEDLEKPCFVQYTVEDAVTYHVSASYGSILRSGQDHSRVLHSQVRVGSYDLDNSNFSNPRGGGGRRSLALSVELPLDDAYMPLRQAIWRATDVQYKDAVEGLTQKRAYMRDRNVEDRPRDFSQGEPVTNVKAPAALTFDRGVWEDNARRLSARFADFKDVQTSEVSLMAGAETRYLVNSEGLRVRDGEIEAILQISAEALAADGERLTDQLAYYAATPAELPAVTEVLADIAKMAERLGTAARASILEEYTGPVLIDEAAAPEMFRQLLARGLAAQPDPVGSARRGPQGLDDLENRLGKRILPPTFQIYDDPRPEKFQGEFLLGHYLLDDEGEAAQRVNLVVDGKLEALLMSRAPTKSFARSNGHGRRSGGGMPRASAGCLYIESSKTQTAEELKKELLDAADAEGLKFGIRITSLHSRPAGGPGGGRFGRAGAPSAAARTVGDPISIYKVYVADGHQEPVRGCEFGPVDLRYLRRITAVGNKQIAHNNMGGAAPSSSVIAPAVLFEELELSRIKRETEKRPLIDAPHARTISQ